MKRVLITGASGLVGGRLAEVLEGGFEVVAARHVAPLAARPEVPTVSLDLLDPSSVDRALEEARADAVVHAAALADANVCEEQPALAQRLNVDASGALARASARRGLRLVALSTDQVFPGDKAWLREEDAVRPLMTYGRTKLEGEEEVLRQCAGSAVLRVALVCGRGHGARPTASESVAWSLRRGQRLRLFTDQYRTPVDGEAVADAIATLLRGTGSGRYHLGGPERVSRHELGLRTARAFGLDASAIEPVTQATFSVGAPRPADASMDSERARRELGFEPRPLDAMIRSGRPEAAPV